jgi:tight adherence protein B
MLPSLILALILVLSGTAVLAAAVITTRKGRLEIGRRVMLVARDQERTSKSDVFRDVLKTRTKKSEVRIRRIFTIGMKHSWGLQVRTLTLLLAGATAASLAWNFARLFLGFSPLSAAVASVAVFYLVPRFLLAREQSRNDRKFMEQFPDALDTVTRMVRAGLPITAAMRTIAVEAAPPLSTVFATIADEMKIGVPIEQVLDTTSREIGLPDFRFFTVAVGLQYTTGGNLATTLELLSDIIRKRRAMRLKAKAATGEIRITAYTLGAIPFLTIGALLVINPGYITPLWTDPRGHFILEAAGICLFLAYITMRTMMRSTTSV